MVSIQEKYRELVRDHVHPRLEKNGFSMRTFGWFYRFEKDCVQRVVVPFDKKHGSAEGDVTVTVCVGYKKLEEFLGSCGELRKSVNFELDRLGCTMASNIGHLSEPSRYRSWAITEQTDLLEVAPEITQRIERDAIRYFERYGTIERVVDAWRKGDRHNLGNLAVLYLAAYEWLYGSRAKAIFDLKSELISADSPATRSRISILLTCLESKMSN